MSEKDIQAVLSKTSGEMQHHLQWMVQTVHQAYHQEVGGEWEDCPRDVCCSTARIQEEWRERFTSLLNSFLDGIDR